MSRFSHDCRTETTAPGHVSTLETRWPSGWRVHRQTASVEGAVGMNPDELKLIISHVAKKNPLFRPIESSPKANGAKVVFEDIQDRDPRTIGLWFEKAGAVVMMIGREWRNNGFVMYVELRA